MSGRRPKTQQGRPGQSARPTSRFLCPRPPLGSSTKEMGRLAGRICGLWLSNADFSGANSVASALGIRHGRDPATDNGWTRLPATPELELQRRPPFRDPEAPVSIKHCARGPTRRILVSLGCLPPPLRTLLRRDRLGYPRLRCDLLRIGFRLRQGGIASRVRLLSYVTQRDRFRLPG